ncbi:hypothetical protein DID78_06285, partial [Candidatus Marinamargulisbacteria bacterium SCGC AG-343-D04]
SDHLTFSLKPGTFPSGMTISSDGLVTWNGPGQFVPSGDIHFTVEVTDGTTSVEKMYTIAYTAVNNPIQFSESDGIIQSFTETTGLNYQVIALDPDSTLSYSIVSAPTGVTIDSTTGLIEWSPGQDVASGDKSIQIEISDQNGDHSITPTLRFHYIAVNNPIQFSEPDGIIQSFNETTGLNYQVNASDPEGHTLQYSIVSPPTGVTIDSTGLITWNPAQDVASGEKSIQISISDGVNVITPTLRFHYTAINDAPTFGDGNTNTFDTLRVGEQWNHTFEIADTDSSVFRQPTYNISPALEGMSINNQGRLTWTPNETGTYSITITVNDGTHSISKEVSLTVSDSNADRSDIPPVIEDHSDTNSSAGHTDHSLTPLIAIGTVAGVAGLLVGAMGIYKGFRTGTQVFPEAIELGQLGNGDGTDPVFDAWMNE